VRVVESPIQSLNGNRRAVVRNQHRHDSAATPFEQHGMITIRPTLSWHHKTHPSAHADRIKATHWRWQAFATCCHDLLRPGHVPLCLCFKLHTGTSGLLRTVPPSLLEYSRRCRFRVFSGPLQGLTGRRGRRLEWRPCAISSGKAASRRDLGVSTRHITGCNNRCELRGQCCGGGTVLQPGWLGRSLRSSTKPRTEA
jgi:hypothetical protein